MDIEKQKFLSEFARDYGYPNAPKNIDQIRASEFKRLDGLVYLDHAGATLYSEQQMEAIFKDLSTNVYGNPHSQSDSSVATSETMKKARQLVLDYCNASPQTYKCIFTSGATAALKLVGETFPWTQESCFMYTRENHNSVLGMREYALSQGAVAFAVDIEEVECGSGLLGDDCSSVWMSPHAAQRRSTARDFDEAPKADSIGHVYNLFAFPSECNFSGVKYSPDLANIVKQDHHNALEGSPYCRGSWMVLIDAAKGSATEPPDLTSFPADFVVISFYKALLFSLLLGHIGYRSAYAAKILRKTYFGGALLGTVAASIADIDYVMRREGIEEWFEDGTQSFLSVASIQYGFKIINTLTTSAIARHTSSLATFTRRALFELRHENGSSVCVLYGTSTKKLSCHGLGPIIAFNLKRPDNSWFGYREVEKLASLSRIQLRTGCFCNPGACSKYLRLSHLELLTNIEAGHVCWDDHDILNGKPTGVVRISFGYMSTFEDAMKFITFIEKSFVSRTREIGSGFGLDAHPIDFSHKEPHPSVTEVLDPPVPTLLHPKATTYQGACLKSITIYPIKSCRGFSVDSWPLCSSGLQHDREWILKSPSGEVLTQKKVPEMCLVSTFIDLEHGILFVESPRCDVRVQIDLLKAVSQCGAREEIMSQFHRYEVQCYDSEVNLWFTNAIGRPCTLLRCVSSQPRRRMNECSNMTRCRDMESKLSFVNEAQILLISEESVSDLNSKLSSKHSDLLLWYDKWIWPFCATGLIDLVAFGDFENDNNKGLPIHVHPMRFRPNLVISGAGPYTEDLWRVLTIGKEHFVSIGGCNRCEMINVDPQTGQRPKSKEPLATLASFRRVKGKILFGILLSYDGAAEVGDSEEKVKPQLTVGQEVYPCSVNSKDIDAEGTSVCI
ncbi:hypothetical protein Syun_009284 [Stephania yunnanensis]|uniref:Molybdenum cofactor sulfurase n=1 Tax=Stephania yunnanensis TaxID=152371 RepID=A0AAP0KGV1_9MAGN